MSIVLDHVSGFIPLIVRQFTERAENLCRLERISYGPVLFNSIFFSSVSLDIIR